MVLLCSVTVCANCRSNDVIVSSVFFFLPIRRDKVTKNYTIFAFFFSITKEMVLFYCLPFTRYVRRKPTRKMTVVPSTMAR